MAQTYQYSSLNPIQNPSVTPADIARSQADNNAASQQSSQSNTQTGSTAVFSANDAQDYLNSKILPAISSGTAAVNAQNAVVAAKNQMAQANQGAAKKPGEATSVVKDQSNASLAANGNATDASQKTPEQQIADTPEPSHQWVYDANGNRSQVPIGAMPAGFSVTPPPKNPVTANTPILSEFFGTDGAKYQSFSDGTYGKLDSSGRYIGQINGAEFDEQHDQSPSGIIANLRSEMVSVTNGSYPLTPVQQAQVNGINSQFDALEKQQDKINKNLTGGTTVAMNLYGMGTSLSGMAEIQETVSSGIAKIGDLQAKAASAVADMTSSFNKDNMANLLQSYNAYKDAQDEMQTHFDKIQDAISKKAEDDRNYNLNVQKFDLSKKSEDFDEAYKREDLALKERANQIADNANVPPSVPVTATGAPDAVAQKNFLASLPPATATAVKELAAYKMNPTDLSSRAGPNGTPSQRQQMITLAHQYDPNYDENQYAARAAYLKNLQSGTLATAILSANKAVAHLDSFSKEVVKLGNTPSSKLNTVLGAGMSMLSPTYQESKSKAATDALGVKDELAKFFKGSGSTDITSIEEWGKQVNENESEGSVKGTVSGAISLMHGQLESITQQYRSVMGRDPELGDIVQPETMAHLSDLKNRGYEVDIPGVLYTDKSAYVKNTPDAQTSLQSAYNDLVSANDPANPPTPDNVLELAQLKYQ